MTASEVNSSPQDPDETLFQQLESYPFSTDTEFQSGLSSILASNPSQPTSLLILRARCFYYARKHNTAVNFETYRTWRSQQNLPAVTLEQMHRVEPASPDPQSNGMSIEKSDVTVSQQGEGQPSAPYPSSFSQIVDLITKGEPIPGIKEIPDTLLVGQESAPTQAKRKKPWESDDAVMKEGDRTGGGHD
ncbi:MAG: hypothetical protein LQ350_001499 [Teloschistes chrysophthalmus]|nr:MAG: hypothetical protein LQ350_001499 [Niorma chrysophthalma]